MSPEAFFFLFGALLGFVIGGFMCAWACASLDRSYEKAGVWKCGTNFYKLTKLP